MCCANCGTKQNEGEKYCPNCGQKFECKPLKTEKVSTEVVFKSNEILCVKGIKNINEVQKVITKGWWKLNLSTPEVSDEEIKKLVNAAESGDKDAQLRLAIKYEFGLGVDININESEKYYKLIGNEDIFINSFTDEMLYRGEKGMGILENKYKVDPEAYFKNEIKNFKNVSKKGDIHFRYYIEYHSRTVYRILEDKIRKYNQDYSGRKNHQEITEYSKASFYYLIEGVFQKKYTNVGGLKLLFIDSKDIELEKEAEKSFLEICDLCETIKLKL